MDLRSNRPCATCGRPHVQGKWWPRHPYKAPHVKAVPMKRPDDCPVYAGCCSLHGFTHGAEAEELRAGIESVLVNADVGEMSGDEVRDAYRDVMRTLQELLDEVDARDSTAFREIPE